MDKVCSVCDCFPCMCGSRDYPSDVCRSCDCSPCICGQNDFSSPIEHERQQQAEISRSDDTSSW